MYSDVRTRLEGLMRERILVLEGPKGTMIQRSRLSEQDYRGEVFGDHPAPLRNNNETLNLVKPDLVESIHYAFGLAGADILATNTFNGNRVSQADFRMEGRIREINLAACRIARSAAERVETETGRKLFVAGTMGPTSRMASMSPDVARPAYRSITFDELAEAYAEQAEALLDGGADLLIVETTFDTLNLKAALYALAHEAERRGSVIPVIASVTFSDRSGRTLAGQTVEAFWVSVSHYPLLAVGVNCGMGAHEIRGRLEEMAAIATVPVVCYPNAGLPNALGEYEQTPDEMALLLREFGENGLLNIVGGCCGSTPEHIGRIASAVKDLNPRVPAEPNGLPRYAGLDALAIRPDSNFTMVGERTNVTGSRRFARLIRSGNYDDACQVARAQVEGGANIIDVNMDEGLLDSALVMREFLSTVASEPDVARAPVMVDSSRWDTLVAGLKATQGKCIVNSISLKDGETAFRERAREARRLGASIVVMAFDEQGQAETTERKVAICERAYGILVEEEHVPAEEIIFDANVLSIGTGIPEHAGFGRSFIDAVQLIKQRCPGALCSGGISNLSFAFRGHDTVREAMHAAFLYHAIHAGLDMGIVNTEQLAVYEEIEPGLRELVEDLILNRRPDATDRLLDYALGAGASDQKSPEVKAGTNGSAEEAPLDERIARSLIHGSTDTIDSEMAEALEAYASALEIVEGPLMAAMNTIGDRFADGRMFLPQVVKSARTMKRAVAYLTPYMAYRLEPDGGSRADSGRARIVLATVKGDVHDIGKNIVGVVLGCAGHEIVDLGVMTPADTILDAAIEKQADMVGLSGLITPSLDEMAHVAREMQRRGFTIPLLIGGAATSRMHTAIRIAGEYDGPVVHVLDASRAGPVVKDLLDPVRRATYVSQVRAEQSELRAQFASRTQERRLLSLEDARLRAPKIDWSAAAIAKPSFTGVRAVTNVTVTELRTLIDWTPFFHVWGIKGRYPEVFAQDGAGERAAELFADANGLLDELGLHEAVRPLGVYGFFPADAHGDDIRVFGDAGRQFPLAEFPMLRQQADKGASGVNYCLADYVAPSAADLTDYFGMFVVTAGARVHELARESREALDDYRAIMLEALADRLAEAFAEWLHREARRDCGFGLSEDLSAEDLIKERYRGIRPAPGYPACPDHSQKRLIFELLGANDVTGVQLTETLAMAPPSSVCGFYLMHPEARYFPVGVIGHDQFDEYMQRSGGDRSEIEHLLRSSLASG